MRGIVLAALLSVLGCETAEPERATRPEPERGQIAYSHACAPCHGPQGRGRGPMGVTLGASDFTDPAVHLRLTDAYVRAKITRGGERMPPIPGLTEAEMVDVAHYLRRMGEPVAAR